MWKTKRTPQKVRAHLQLFHTSASIQLRVPLTSEKRARKVLVESIGKWEKRIQRTKSMTHKLLSHDIGPMEECQASLLEASTCTVRCLFQAIHSHMGRARSEWLSWGESVAVRKEKSTASTIAVTTRRAQRTLLVGVWSLSRAVFPYLLSSSLHHPLSIHCHHQHSHRPPMQTKLSLLSSSCAPFRERLLFIKRCWKWAKMSREERWEWPS